MKNNNQHNQQSNFKRTEYDVADKTNFDAEAGLSGYRSAIEAGFTVPKNYFANASDKIIADNLKPTPVVTLFSRKNIMYASSIAATILLSIFFFKPNTPTNTFDDIPYASLVEYADDEFTDAYDIASLPEFKTDDLDDFSEIPVDESEVFDYLIDEDNIEINDTNL